MQRPLGWLRAMCLAGAALLGACEPAPPAETTMRAQPASPPAVAAPAAPQAPGESGFGADVGFRSRRAFLDHFEKHGKEFGAIAAAEYLRRAQALRDTVVGGDILEVTRDDRVRTRFDRSSGDFLAFNDDGTIRTFFRPNDGERYFRRQARRRPRS